MVNKLYELAFRLRQMKVDKVQSKTLFVIYQIQSSLLYFKNVKMHGGILLKGDKFACIVL